MDKLAEEKRPEKAKSNPSLYVKDLKKKTYDIPQRIGQADRQQNPNPRIACAERRVKPLARLLRRATAPRVTAPLGCGSRRLVWPKGSFRLRPKYE